MTVSVKVALRRLKGIETYTQAKHNEIKQLFILSTKYFTRQICGTIRSLWMVAKSYLKVRPEVERFRMPRP